MPEFRNRSRRSRVGKMLNSAARRKILFRARAGGSISPAEYQQYRDFYLGLAFLDGRNDNFITRRLWARLWLPLGLEKRCQNLNLKPS